MARKRSESRVKSDELPKAGVPTANSKPATRNSQPDLPPAGDELPAPPPEFQPGLPPDNPANRLAGEARGLFYNTAERVWVDADGKAIRDRLGELLED